MRNALVQTIVELMDRDPNIILMTGDLGFGVLAPLIEQFPRQFVNAGVAEQNMTGMAAGMALTGKTVFTYSIANFPVLRCLEQIRNDICYHNANVIIVPIGGGMAYGALGPSHHATEDLAIMRAMPNMTVVAPGDPIETRLAVRALVKQGGPCYLRIGHAGEPEVYQDIPEFTLGRSITLRQGTDVTLISTGGMLHNCINAAEILQKKGISARIISMHTLKPFDSAAVLDASTQTQAIFTVEEHSIIGGLGGAVAEVLLESTDRNIEFQRIGLSDGFSSVVGDRNYLWNYYGLDSAAIAQRVLDTLN